MDDVLHKEINEWGIIAHKWKPQLLTTVWTITYTFKMNWSFEQADALSQLMAAVEFG